MAILSRLSAVILTSIATVACLPEVEGSRYALDTLHGVDDGKLVSPHRAIVKLDCAECPTINTGIEGQSQALILDFTTFPSSESEGHRPDTLEPSVFVNNYLLVSWEGRRESWAPFARSVSANTTIDEYMSNPSNYSDAYLLPNMTSRWIATAQDWKMFSILLEVEGYKGYEDQERTTVSPSSTHLDAISGVKLYVRLQNASDVEAKLAPELCNEILHHEHLHDKEIWTLEWIEILDKRWLNWLSSMNAGSHYDPGRLPLGLESKMSKEWDYYRITMPTNQKKCLAPTKQEDITSEPSRPKGIARLRIGPMNPFQIFAMILLATSVIIGPVWAIASLMRRMINRVTGGWLNEAIGYRPSGEEMIYKEWEEKKGRILL
ncbi:uncharacterized protein KY384_002277 [Bacidia gigantensis]|uniref:uncharacterized protein n=1 Tax=Bacidia gigantensis TaxID=2732470 RepID=UPI001D03A2C9|nr:uncharacterized protein KY384_002277 [Bacidia gigantensis]KAG8533492.1 hypothetical protein KY384_002277 [Bacidia gigantensis]